MTTLVKRFIENVKERVSADILIKNHVQKQFKYVANQCEVQLEKLKSNLIFASTNVAEEAYSKEKEKNMNDIITMMQKLPKQVQQVLEKRGDFFFENVELENFEAPSLNFKKFTNCSGFFQMKEDKRNGRGIEFFDSGAYFEGYFKNDRACGKGYYISAAGLIHEGNNKDNTYQGYGEWPLEESFFGEHNDNQANGFGKKLYKNGETYLGFWKDNKRFGYGEIQNKGKVVSKGIYHNDKIVKQL